MLFRSSVLATLFLSQAAGTGSKLGYAHCEVDYHDRDGLTRALGGVHTVLSFIQTLIDPDNVAQINLIDDIAHG